MDILGFAVYLLMVGTVMGLLIYYLIKLVRIANGMGDKLFVRKQVFIHIAITCGEGILVFIYSLLKR